MATTFDVIIIGLGAMGSATAYHLSRRGCRVLGLDRFTPPHTFGSSHGQTRIIREAYFEHPIYVPMVQRAYCLWSELEREAGGRLLFQQTGGLMIGLPDSVMVRGARLSAETHHLPHEVLSAQEIRERFPALHPEPAMIGVLEPRAGILFPEPCISAYLDLAGKYGAILRFNETVLSWSASNDISVRTANEEFHATQLVLCAGSWINTLLPGLALPFTVERQVLSWFEPRQSPALFDPQRCPVHLWQFDGRHFFYGFPNLGDGVKVARHHDGEITTPEEVRREVSPGETEEMRAIVQRFLPSADGPLLSATVCLYTNTPDEHFWIDWHPQYRQVLIASPCSGHGFKFSSVAGEILADLLLKGESRFDVSLFRQRRFGKGVP